tara:strand:- start:3970 stop:5127 length:1158 start_codon:yes stop_codon:yes gene_type:complete
MDEQKHNLGQYFTTNEILQEKIYEFILNNPETILEPCIGRGDLVDYICSRNLSVNFNMYEIDNNLELLSSIKHEDVKFNDFMKEPINESFKTIIGNPPYVRTKKGNLYIDFTEKCFHLLEENGELIFIVPSDFFKLTSASNLLQLMITNGTFTHIFHPNNEGLFEDAAIDVLIFRYCKNNKLPKKVSYNDKNLHITNCNGLITFNQRQITSSIKFEDYFNIYVGLVSGKENVFKHDELGNIDVLNGDGIIERYIYINKFPTENDELNEYMKTHKNELLQRKIRKFNEKNWYEWGAPRNIKAIENNIGQDCIYINNLTRKPIVAFSGKVGYFGGGLIAIIPKKKCKIKNIIDYLNSDTFKNNFLFSGRFKIGHRQISNSYIPKKYL